ncbi:5191_t:CDS:2 [Dentiscutata erythropus]|uniref:5191_t:CDS:1 n=1 Tax=Dentiscutata erythropus TaxID=1348616 RepID=A0A9N9E173_9GLOM|nr:5191_t:CDS:2 [Dentiscutata erythropus]
MNALQINKELTDAFQSFDDLHEEILYQIFDYVDELITEKLHPFLTEFFNKHHSPEGWDNAVDEIVINKSDFEIICKTKKLLKWTLVQFGEIPMRRQKTNIQSDGVGYINDVSNYAIVIREGARPNASTKKNISIDAKVVKSMVCLYNHIILSEAYTRYQLFANLHTYGITAHQTEVCLLMLDFRDNIIL